MNFAAKLKSAAGTLTAAQIAAATGVSKRTVEGWRAGKQPLPAYRADILARVKRAAGVPAKIKWHHDGGDLHCEIDGICASVCWMVAPWRYQVLCAKKVNDEWQSIDDSPSFPLSADGRAQAKEWATKWVLSVLANAKDDPRALNP